MKKQLLINHLAIVFLLITMSNYTAAKSENIAFDPIAEQLSIEELYNLPIIDIATGYAVPLEKAPSVATVITAKDIKAMGAVSLNEVLEAVPGLHVHPSALTSSIDIFSIRGIYTNRGPQVLVLLNGHRISSDISSGTTPDTAMINVQNISHIEVIRGPGSAVYGADAFSGVINIITKTARELDGFHSGIHGGSFSTKNIWAQYGGTITDNWKLAANFEFMKQNADKSRVVEIDAQSGLDNLLGTSASIAPSYLDRRYQTFSYNVHLDKQNWKIGFDGWIQRDLGIGSGIAHTLDHESYTDVDQLLFTLEYKTKDWYKGLEFNAKFSYQYINQDYHLRIFPPGNMSLVGADGNLFTPPFNPILFTNGVIGNPERTSQVPQLDLVFLYSGIKNHTSRFNMGIKQEKLSAKASQNFGPGAIDTSASIVDATLTELTGTPYIYLPNTSRTVKFMSIQDMWEISLDWSLTIGIRYDHYDDFGSTTNPRAALIWTPSPNLVTKILYGRAFRAPAFAELYLQNNPVTIGNPSLKPETIDTAEIAFDYDLMYNLNFNLSFYQYKAKDMIDFVDIGSGGSIAQNVYTIKGKGIELESKWKVNKQWSLIANYAYQRTINQDTNQQQPYVPKQQFYFDTRWKFYTDWVFSTQLNWIGDRKRAVSDTRENIDDYTQVNLTLRKKNINKHWEIAASIKNIFDHDIREPSDGVIANDYPMNGRSAYIELNYNY